jgi:hypothetical protein
MLKTFLTTDQIQGPERAWDGTNAQNFIEVSDYTKLDTRDKAVVNVMNVYNLTFIWTFILQD